MSYDVAGARRTGDGRSFRDIVSERVVAHGGWCMIPSAFSSEIVSASGCDWLCIDTQHGLIDDAAMRAMVQAAAIRSTPVTVRVPWNEPASIMRALDAGADGVIVPMVNTPDDARLAVAASKYPPLGVRSWGPVRSAMAHPGFNPAVGNERAVCIVMIETVEAYKNLEAILDVPGVGGVFVGPNDLAISHAGTNDGAGTSAKDVEMIERIAHECSQRDLGAGIACADAADAQRWEQAGYTLLALQSDAALLGDGLTRLLASARGVGRAGMKLGVITTGLLQHDFEQGLDRVRELGIEAIELGCGGFHSKKYADPATLLASDVAFARWRSAFEERGLGISALAVHGDPLSPDPDVARQYEMELRQACELAERIGVTRLTLLAGLPEGRPGDRTPCWVVTPFPPYNLEAVAWQWEERLIPYWREKARIAADHGCRLCFEMSPSDMVFNPEALLRLRAEIGPQVGCNFDPSHLFWQQIDPIEAIAALGDAIYHVHAKDTQENERYVRVNGVLDAKPHSEFANRAWVFRTVGYGHGRSFWCDFVSMLRTIGYDDVVSIEHEDDLIAPDEGLAKATDFLRGVLIEQPVTARWWESMAQPPKPPG